MIRAADGKEVSGSAEWVVKLPGLGKDRLLVRGNNYPQTVARFDTREAAQAIADKCPASFKADVACYVEAELVVKVHTLSRRTET